MDTPTTNPTTIFSRWTRVRGTILTLALLVSAVAFSQPYTNPNPVVLGTAGNFRILAPTITIDAVCTVTGNVGGITVTHNGTVIGDIWGTTVTGGGAVSATHPVGTTVSDAQNDLTTAYNSAAGRTISGTTGAALAVELGGQTLGCGVYSGGTFTITGATLTLTGTATDIFIFKVGSTLKTFGACHVTMAGTALASNVFWQVGSSATIEGDFKGNILAQTSITQTSGTIEGELLARDGAVALSGTSVGPEVVVVTNPTTAWQMQLKASIGTVQDNESYVGVADNATDGFDPSFDTPKPPPAPGNYVSLYFPHHEWGSLLGDNFATDIKKNTALADAVKGWCFQVKSNVNGMVTLSIVNDRIPSGFGKYLTDVLSGTRVNLKNSSSYTYSNTSETARSFWIIIGDNTSPSLTLTTPNGSNIWQSGTIKNIVWSTIDGTGIYAIDVYSSSDRGSTYALIGSLNNVQSTNWTVPSEYLNNNYSIKIISRDSLDNQTAVSSANTFTVVGDSLATSNSTGWSLISLPLQPSNLTVDAILGDDFTSSPYYLWSYDQSSGYVSPTSLQFGRGYWLGATSTPGWDVRGAAVETDKIVTDIPIGYTIIGSNFVRNVPIQSIGFRKGGVDYSFSEAVTQGILVNAIYGYDGTSYGAMDALEMFKGYWLGILQQGVQMIQAPAGSSETPLMKIVKPMQSMWDLSIVASSSKQTDRFAKIGMRLDATNDFDVSYDVPQPPRPPGNNYIELYFPHSGQHYPTILGSKYAHDYRGIDNPQWSFIFETSDSGQVNLHWDNTVLNQLSNLVQLTLTDVATSTSIDMSQQNSYGFTYSVPRSFNIVSLITGLTEPQDILPSSYTLSQNYPNPFNPSTKIQFSIPQATFVTLKIFDALGREIASLAEGFRNAGTYSATWNATKVPSGIYFYRLNAGTFTATKKLVLLR